MFLPWPAMLGQQRSLLITEPKDRADESGVSIIPRYAKFCGTMEAKPLFQFVRRSWLFLTLMKVFTKSSLDTGLCLCFLIPNLKPQSHHNQEMQCFSCWCQPLPLTGDPATPPPRPHHANIHNRKASVTMANCWNEVEILFFIRALPAIIVNSELAFHPSFFMEFKKAQQKRQS